MKETMFERNEMILYCGGMWLRRGMIGPGAVPITACVAQAGLLVCVAAAADRFSAKPAGNLAL